MYKRGAAYSQKDENFKKSEELWRVGTHSSPLTPPVFIGISGEKVKSEE